MIIDATKIDYFSEILNRTGKSTDKKMEKKLDNNSPKKIKKTKQ